MLFAEPNGGPIEGVRNVRAPEPNRVRNRRQAARRDPNAPTRQNGGDGPSVVTSRACGNGHRLRGRLPFAESNGEPIEGVRNVRVPKPNRARIGSRELKDATRGVKRRGHRPIAAQVRGLRRRPASRLRNGDRTGRLRRLARNSNVRTLHSLVPRDP
jgi:hypothetical protein